MKPRKRPLRKVYWLVVDRYAEVDAMLDVYTTREAALCWARADSCYSVNGQLSVIRVTLDAEHGEEVVKA